LRAVTSKPHNQHTRNIASTKNIEALWQAQRAREKRDNKDVRREHLLTVGRHPTLVKIFSCYARLEPTTSMRGSRFSGSVLFSEISSSNKTMDIREFQGWGEDYQLVPQFIDKEGMLQLFLSLTGSNITEHANAGLSYQDFVAAASECVRRVEGSTRDIEQGSLPPQVLELMGLVQRAQGGLSKHVTTQDLARSTGRSPGVSMASRRPGTAGSTRRVPRESLHGRSKEFEEHMSSRGEMIVKDQEYLLQSSHLRKVFEECVQVRQIALARMEVEEEKVDRMKARLRKADEARQSVQIGTPASTVEVLERRWKGLHDEWLAQESCCDEARFVSQKANAAEREAAIRLHQQGVAIDFLRHGALQLAEREAHVADGLFHPATQQTSPELMHWQTMPLPPPGT